MTPPEQQLFTVTIYSENCVGLINQVSTIFTRRCLNLEDVSSSASSVPDIHKTTLTTWADRPTMEKVVKQIEKRVDVIKAFLYTDDEIVYQEVALYKVPTSQLVESGAVEDIVRHHGARILEMTADYTVIEKSGHPWETEALLDRLRSLGIRQFVRSGRVAVTKSPIEYVDLYLEEQRLRQEKIENEPK